VDRPEPIDRWISFQLGRLNAGLVVEKKSLARLLRETEPTSRTREGDPHPFEREGDVRCIETPTGEVATTVHVGPYDRLGDAHNAIHAWCAANNRKIAQASWEIYGDWNDDPALLVTTIKYLLA